MTPNDIDVLLHYHITIKPHPRRNAPAVSESIEHFVQAHVFSVTYIEETEIIRLLPRGRKLVEMLCSTPLPVPVWKDPRENNV